MSAAFQCAHLPAESKLMGEQISLGQQLKALFEISEALSTQSDIEDILELILDKAIELTHCEGASVCIVEKEGVSTSRAGKTCYQGFLRFYAAMSRKEGIKIVNKKLPLNQHSIAGYVACTGEVLNIADAYHLPQGAPYAFNSSFDKENNYRTESILAVPIKTSDGRTLGVLQLINKVEFDSLKRRPFATSDIELMKCFASQSAISLNNTRLRHDITQLFRSFVNASVTAIESRDPSTSGHSARVAILTVALARAVGKSQHPRFKDVHYSEQQIKEIRFASLLHDFGKIGVREAVLIKQKKLLPEQLSEINWRLKYVQASTERKLWRQLCEVPNSSHEQTLAKVEHYKLRFSQIESAINVFNQPKVFTEYVSLDTLVNWCHSLEQELGEQILRPEELAALSIPKGSLTESERLEIEAHVTGSYRFLKKIAWNEGLENVPYIAYGHHEKLDGTGYPLQLKADDIELPTRMMTIADIFDSLTATDRPYKKATPVDITLRVLQEEAQQGKLDSELVQMFIEQKIYCLAVPEAEDGEEQAA